MKRAAASLVLATVALAQQAPEYYRYAYRVWRQADPSLETDAATAGPTLGARADKVAAEAATYFAARKAYLDRLLARAEQDISALPSVADAAQTGNIPANYLTPQTNLVTGSINAIANDPDRGIQQLRQALERERTALAAITASLAEAQKTQDAAVQATTNAEQVRAKVAEDFQMFAASLKQSGEETGQAATAWANYYRALSDAVRGTAGGEAPAVSSAAPIPAPDVTVNNPAPTSSPGVTPVPLSRYVGAWTYPTVGAHYHGVQPASVDLVVREDNGQANGTLYARFVLPPGNADDPVVRFDFKGAFQNTRNQVFPLTTNNGAKGRVELIPGPAFNLIEINFITEDKRGTVKQANFLLVKK
jgi:hypothetical protein